MLEKVQDELERALAAMESRDIRVHDCEPRADNACVTWAKSFRLVQGQKALQKVAGIRCGSCAAHTYPFADERVVTLGGQLITWLFLFDDAYGEGPQATDARDLMSTLSTYSRLLRTGARPVRATPFHTALLDMRTRALELTQSQDWLNRFADSFDCYFGGCVMEFYARRQKGQVDLQEYRRLRTWSIGTFPVFDLIELSKRPLAASEAAAPELQALKERAALLCAWANDIYSFRKEHEDGDSMNLVAVLAREFGLSLGEAFGAAAEVFNTDWALFEEERNLLLSLQSESLAAYATGLEEWIFGNLSWTALCRRYHLEVRAVS